MPDDHFPWVTFFVGVIAVIVVGIGGVAVLTDNMSFDEYVNDIIKFAAAAGLTAIGRGIKARNTP